MIKDYIRVTELSAEFNSWHAQRVGQSFDDTAKNAAWEARMWELQCLLAIAQQLSVVAAHLGKITRKAEELNDKD
jgi:hypothetical protein